MKPAMNTHKANLASVLEDAHAKNYNVKVILKNKSEYKGFISRLPEGRTWYIVEPKTGTAGTISSYEVSFDIGDVCSVEPVV